MANPPLMLSWESGASFLERYSPARQSVLCNVDSGVSTEGVVSVIVRFEDRSTEFHLHATVAAEADGLRVTFHEDERDRLDLVLAAAEGDSVPYFKRRHPRVECNLEIKYGPALLRRTGRATNVSRGGMYIRVAQPIALDQVLQLTVLAPNGERIKVQARVASRVTAGPDLGNGLEFLYESAEQAKRVDALLVELGATDDGWSSHTTFDEESGQ